MIDVACVHYYSQLTSIGTNSLSVLFYTVKLTYSRWFTKYLDAETNPELEPPMSVLPRSVSGYQLVSWSSVSNDAVRYADVVGIFGEELLLQSHMDELRDALNTQIPGLFLYITHAIRQGAYARGGHGGLAPPPNGCTINYIIVSAEAILSAENSGKPLGGRYSAPNPAGGAHSALPDALAGGERVAAPPQERTPPPLSTFAPSVLAPSPMKNPGHAMRMTLYIVYFGSFWTC